MSDDYVKIGEKWADQPPAVFELVIDDYLPYINPTDYNLNIAGIDPRDYFITSGDAVQKSIVLEQDLWRHAGEVRKLVFEQLATEKRCTMIEAQELYRNGTRPKKPRGLADYESKIWEHAGRCRKLLNALRAARGENTFLETEWNNHRLLCIPKNPRK